MIEEQAVDVLKMELAPGLVSSVSSFLSLSLFKEYCCLLKKLYLYLILLYECFGYMCVCWPCMHLASEEVRRSQIPWSRNYSEPLCWC